MDETKSTPLLSRVITVAEKPTYTYSKEVEMVDNEPKPTWTRVGIKDENNNRYSFFTKKQGNLPSVAYQSFLDGKVEEGSLVEIVYKEKPGINSKTQEPVLYLNIVKFNASEGTQPVPDTSDVIKDIPF